MAVRDGSRERSRGQNHEQMHFDVWVVLGQALSVTLLSSPPFQGGGGCTPQTIQHAIQGLVDTIYTAQTDGLVDECTDTETRRVIDACICVYMLCLQGFEKQQGVYQLHSMGALNLQPRDDGGLHLK